MKDCSLPFLGDLFFIILVLWGSFFTLNLLLAVLEVNFSQGKEDDKVRIFIVLMDSLSYSIGCQPSCRVNAVAAS